jgi:methionyl aminopeptidase
MPPNRATLMQSLSPTPQATPCVWCQLLWRDTCQAVRLRATNFQSDRSSAAVREYRPMLHGKRKIQLAKPERDAMRRAGSFNGQLMDYIRDYVRAGITTGEIDRLVHEYTIQHGHQPATLGYQGYPKSCCTSVNEVICHGIPSDYVLTSGDIVNVDLTTIVDGWHGDSSETFLIGEVTDEARGVTQCAFDCLYAAIEAIKPGCRVSDVGDAIVRLASSRGFSVVREFVGHGLGQQFHQEPTVPHFPTRQSRRDRLYPGTCFTIEPMINVGGRQGMTDKSDGWTVRTKDLSLSAQFEHTILMTETGPEILTQTARGPRPGYRF